LLLHSPLLFPQGKGVIQSEQFIPSGLSTATGIYNHSSFHKSLL